jgi:hypothetical protein
MTTETTSSSHLDKIRDGSAKAMSVFYVNGKHSRKARKHDETAYLVVKSTPFGMESTTKVLKNNQEDTTGQYASAFCLVTTAATGAFGDMGDTYWSQIYLGELHSVDGRPPTSDELMEWGTLAALNTGVWS